MKVLVCGGRYYADADRVSHVLTAAYAQYGITLLIEGGAPGADRMARVWAQRKGVHVATVDALWHSYRKRAGPLRNAAMLQLKPDMVIAFPGHEGTADMMKQAREAGVPVIEVPDHV